MRSFEAVDDDAPFRRGPTCPVFVAPLLDSEIEDGLGVHAVRPGQFVLRRRTRRALAVNQQPFRCAALERDAAMLQPFLAAGGVRPGARIGDVRRPQQAAVRALRLLYILGPHTQEHGAVCSYAAATPDPVAQANAVHLERLAPRDEPACFACLLVAAHHRMAARARIEQLVAQRRDLRLLEPLRVREQRPQLECGELVDLLLAPLRHPAPGQDRCGTGVLRDRAHLAGPLHGLDVGGARALGALLDLVLHLVVLLQRLEPARLDGREVHEEILAAVIGRDEAEALGVVEPLYGTCTHVCFLDIDWIEGRHRKRGGPAENQGENQPTRTVRTATTRPATRCLRILLYRYTGIRARSPV